MVTGRTNLVLMDGVLVHRPWFKVILNPFLRRMGFVIVSVFTDDDLQLLGYELRRWPSFERLK